MRYKIEQTFLPKRVRFGARDFIALSTLMAGSLQAFISPNPSIMKDCPRCGFPCFQEADIKAIEDLGMCLLCDKIQADIESDRDIDIETEIMEED